MGKGTDIKGEKLRMAGALRTRVEAVGKAQLIKVKVMDFYSIFRTIHGKSLQIF